MQLDPLVVRLARQLVTLVKMRIKITEWSDDKFVLAKVKPYGFKIDETVAYRPPRLLLSVC